jgi:hypothetical protein
MLTKEDWDAINESRQRTRAGTADNNEKLLLAVINKLIGGGLIREPQPKKD